ncbi:MAG: hypothetical protein PHN88_15910 [Ignavibacteria bacterium]|nr:hypothetical protein [Ignavibacteria bacterium]
MIDIFENISPRWKNAVKTYASDVWNKRDIDKARKLYNDKALLFSRSYRLALEKHYREKGMNVYRGTLDGKMQEWLQRQYALRDTLPGIIEQRQTEIVQKEIERFKNDESYTAQQMLNKIYEAKENENVYKVFSFKDHFKNKSEQIGDENAYDLGTKINEGIITQFSDRYYWRTQKDTRVRSTHQQLADKCFLFNDPPTEKLLNGKSYTGNPGAISWGCRCWAEIAPARAKVRRHYVVYEKKKKN